MRDRQADCKPRALAGDRLLEHPRLRLLQFEVGLLERLVGKLSITKCLGKFTIRPAQFPCAFFDLGFQQVVGLLQFRLGSLDLSANAACDPLQDP